MRVLQKSHEGISINLLTYHEPNCIYLTDACKIGMIGFSSKGRARRWKIPIEILGCAHINLLELYSELVSIYIDIVEETLDDKECLLSMGYSTTAIRWIHKARKPDPNDHPQLNLAKNKTPKTTSIPAH